MSKPIKKPSPHWRFPLFPFPALTIPIFPSLPRRHRLDLAGISPVNQLNKPTGEACHAAYPCRRLFSLLPLLEPGVTTPLSPTSVVPFPFPFHCHIRQIVKISKPMKLPALVAIEILALKGGSWRRIDQHPRGICNVLVSIQFFAFVHATFHWVTISSNYFEVVSFNISNEVYEEIPLSEEILSLRPDSKGIGVCVLGGMLCVYSNTSLPSPGNDIFKIWALKEYGVKGSWMLLLTVEEPDWYLNAKPTYLFADGEVLFRCMSYQHIGHTFRTLNGPFRSWPICDTMQGGSAFTESLISPKSLTY